MKIVKRTKQQMISELVELRHRVRELTNSQEEMRNTVAELRRSQNDLRHRDKMRIIRQMAAGMAHEIKNPLTAVKGFAQLIREKYAYDETLTSYAAIMLDEIEQANGVITNFLQLASPKKPVLMRRSFNIIVKEVLAALNLQAAQKNIELVSDCTAKLPRCLVDRNQIKQVIINICQNAMEAMPQGGTMRITTGLLSESNEIYIDIQDTGYGIPSDKLGNIGVPFYTTKADGMGLNLSISYSIIYAHKGRVEVISTEGKGTRFRICLPYQVYYENMAWWLPRLVRSDYQVKNLRKS